MLLLDAGKSLLKNKNSQDKISLIKAQNIAEAYILMGYDAVAVSEADLTLESTFLRKTHEKGFPWISANIVDKNGLPALRSHVIKTINSMDIGIIGITDGLATSDTYTTIDYHEPLKQLTDQLAVQTDLIILLSNLKLKVNQEIAKQYPDIDIILSSDRSSGRMPPKTINNCLITQTSSRGKYLGKLNIEWNNGTAWHNDRVVPLSVLIKTKTSIETQLTNLKDSTSKKKIARLQLRHQRLVKEIEARRALGEDSNSLTNKHKLSFIPIQPTHAPQQVELVVENIDKLIHKERKAQ